MRNSLIARRHLMFTVDPPEGDQGGGGDPKPGEFAPITSQDEFNRRIQERIVRVRAEFPDYADLKAKAAAHDKALEDARTDQERAVEAAKAEGRTEALSTANARLLSAEARALAAEAKFRNPALAVKSIDLSGVKVADDGTVDAEAVRAALKTLAESEPYLVDDGKNPRPKPDRHQGGGDGSPKPAGVNAGREIYEAKRKPTTSTP